MHQLGAFGRGLPVELWDLCLDHVDEVKTLAVCSRVCKTWLRRAQRNLFRNVVVDGVRDTHPRKPLPGSMLMTTFIERFEEQDDEDDEDYTTGASQSSNDSGSTSVSTASSDTVADKTIASIPMIYRGARARSFTRSLSVGDFTELKETETEFLDVLSLFCELPIEQLALRYCSAPLAERELLDTCRFSFAETVTHLDIRWNFDSVVILAEYVSHFKNLNTLTLACNVFRELQPTEVPARLHQRCSVYFELPSTDNIFTRWIARDMSNLAGIWANTDETTAELLRSECIRDPGILPRIKSLYFLIEGSDPRAHHSWESLQERLSQCTGVERLTFRLRYGMHDNVTMLIQRFKTIFCGFGPSIRRISFEGEGLDSPHRGWGTLGDIFRDRFPLLERLPYPIVSRGSRAMAQGTKKEDKKAIGGRSLLDDDGDDDLEDGPPMLGALFEHSAAVSTSSSRSTTGPVKFAATTTSGVVTKPVTSKTTTKASGSGGERSSGHRSSSLASSSSRPNSFPNKKPRKSLNSDPFAD